VSFPSFLDVHSFVCNVHLLGRARGLGRGKSVLERPLKGLSRFATYVCKVPS